MGREQGRRARRAAARPGAAAVLLCAALAVVAVLARPAEAVVDPSPPDHPVKLVFVHHSTGEAWLADGHGGLGLALRDNGYFVSDTNYGWGPGAIGDLTDIGHWWLWFRDPATSPAAMSALLAESGQNCWYSRLDEDPGGENEIVMFKSCFPNSQLSWPASPIPAIDQNPLRGQDCSSEAFTVANAKGIYRDLLDSFRVHPGTLFVAVVAPPVTSPDTPGGRALADWLVDHWLQDTGYDVGNVFVFDYYTVLTSRTGGGASDVGLASGNHHRIWEGVVQHVGDQGADRLAYPSAGGDSHPNAAGDRKATAELLPLLNNAYHAWKGDGGGGGGGDTVGPRTVASGPVTVRRGRTATLRFTVTDDRSATATVTILVRTRRGKLVKTVAAGVRDIGIGIEQSVSFRCRLARGAYRWSVDARDASGNPAQTPLGSARLTVR